MADIFISYKAERRPAVSYLTRVLENYGYSVWFDYGLLSGTAFAPQIEREMRAARAAIVLWCEKSVSSEWVLDEARIAKELGIMLPARIEPVSLPLGYGQLDTIDLNAWDGNPRGGTALDRLIDQVALKVGREPVPNRRALIEQEEQWRLHRHRLAAFPRDEVSARIEIERERQLAPAEAGIPSQRGQMSRLHELIGTRYEKVGSDVVFARFCDPLRPPDEVSCAVFSPDGTGLATMSIDGSTQLWEASSGRLLRTLAGKRHIVGSVAFSPDGSQLVTAAEEARVWDTSDGRLIAALVGHTGSVYRATFSPDGTRIVTASADRTARVWGARSGRLLITLADHSYELWSAAFSRDGTRIVTASGNAPKIWDAASGHLLRTLTGHTAEVRSAVFSPGGFRVLTASNDGTARVWEVSSGRQISTLNGDTPWGVIAEFSFDGRRIVSAAGNTAKVWEARSGRLIANLVGQSDIAPHSGFSDVLLRVSFSPDGSRIVTGSKDQKVRMWDANSGRSLGELLGCWHAPAGDVFSPTGDRIVVINGDGSAQILAIRS